MENRQAFQWIAGALVLIALGLYLVPSGLREHWRYSKLEKRGLVTEGSIVGRFVGKSSGKSTAKEYHVVDVKFKPRGGERLTVSLRVSGDWFAEHHDPSTSKVPVRYLPSDPTVAIIDGEPAPGAFGWILGFCVIGLALLMGGAGLKALE